MVKEENGFELIPKLTQENISELSKRFSINISHKNFNDLIIPTLETLHFLGYFRLYEIENTIQVQYLK